MQNLLIGAIAGLLLGGGLVYVFYARLASSVTAAKALGADIKKL